MKDEGGLTKGGGVTNRLQYPTRQITDYNKEDMGNRYGIKISPFIKCQRKCFQLILDQHLQEIRRPTFPCEVNLCMLIPAETKRLRRALIKWRNAMRHSLNCGNKSRQTNHLYHRNPFNSINATPDPSSVV